MRRKGAGIGGESSEVELVDLHSTAKERYLNYALSVITSRALPDVRDGLKPVQRRILYGMQEMRLNHEAKFRKSAQVVGSVMGRYHPHGDTAIYDAMVRMAQDFSMRYPFVDGHGNFGSLDGDAAAAMRYTEARLEALSANMLEELSEKVVDYRPNYDGSLMEPSVLPAAFPALLANGSMGIAVGMATNIAPHNLGELLDACVCLIDKPEATLEDLMKYVPGPDFPTGGRILNSRDELRAIYETGRGPIDIQADYHVEEEGKRARIVVTSVPYVSNKAQIVAKIAEFIITNKLPLITDVRDESTSDVRIVLELRSGADPEAAMAFVFKHSPLQARFNVNMTCLVPGERPGSYMPERLGLLPILEHFLEFRREVVTRRLEEQLENLQKRIHILLGFKAIFSALDEAIAIIRESADKSDASLRLCARFDIDAIQSEAILLMRLYRLARLEMDKILDELRAKEKEAKHIRKILADPKALWSLIRAELLRLKERHADERRTKFGGTDIEESYAEENYIIDEDYYAIISREGLFKRQKSFADLSTIRTREGDEIRFVLYGSTRSPLILFTNLGNAYTLLLDKVPVTTGHGLPIQAVFKFDDGERVVAAYLLDERYFKPSGNIDESAKTLLNFMEEKRVDEEASLYLVAASRNGQILRLGLDGFETVSTVLGRKFMRLNEGDEVLKVEIVSGGGWVSLISEQTRALVFRIDDIPMLKAAGKGYRGLAMDKGDTLVGFKVVGNEAEGLVVNLARERQITVSSRRFPDGARGARGRLIRRRGKVESIEESIELPEIKT
ncbi:MAG: DNA topoisomerase IV subunit A [Bacteroidales bacterium]